MRKDTHSFTYRTRSTITYEIDFSGDMPNVIGPHISQNALPTVKELLDSFVSLAQLLARRAGESSSIRINLPSTTLTICASHRNMESFGFVGFPASPSTVEVTLPDAKSTPAKPADALPLLATGKKKAPPAGRLKLSKSARDQFVDALPLILKAMEPEDREWHLLRYPQDHELLNKNQP